MHRFNKMMTIALAAVTLIAWAYAAWRGYRDWAVPPAFLALPIALTVATCFGWLLVTLSAVRGDNETRCRRCNHILRGLTQPRCPECGEPI